MLIRLTHTLGLLAVLLSRVVADQVQQLVLQQTPTPALNAKARPLTGRFLHITDTHPDPFYKAHTSPDTSCHKGKGSAGYWGSEINPTCDSPRSLINATFDWIRENVRDQIDFVVWTGDSARHDNDEDIPRTRSEVLDTNRFIVSQFQSTFGARDDEPSSHGLVVPIVPNLGNNDITPHNVFEPGPNDYTEAYLDMWRHFIPEHERHQFQRGGWFSVRVIPGKLQVFSLNTLYFYASNSAIDGCASRDEPGYEQFEWLRVQLQAAREQGIKAILIGHVPPARTDNKTAWEESCWQKYTLWMHQYRDVVVAGLYGHMNIDHFVLQDWKHVKKHVRKGREYKSDSNAKSIIPIDSRVTVQSAHDYLQSLRDVFARIPAIFTKPRKSHWKEIGGPYGERYSLTLVNPSIVPNYYPTIRIYSYNITGLDTTLEQLSKNKPPKKKKGKHKKPKGYKFIVPTGPSPTSLPGPGYSPQPLSLVSYVQLYSNLTYLNNRRNKKHASQPRNLTFSVEYDTATDQAYGLADLTVTSWLRLATAISGSNGPNHYRNKLWHLFVKRAFVGALPEE